MRKLKKVNILSPLPIALLITLLLTANVFVTGYSHIYAKVGDEYVDYTIVPKDVEKGIALYTRYDHFREEDVSFGIELQYHDLTETQKTYVKHFTDKLIPEYLIGVKSITFTSHSIYEKNEKKVAQTQLYHDLQNDEGYLELEGYEHNGDIVIVVDWDMPDTLCHEIAHTIIVNDGDSAVHSLINKLGNEEFCYQ